MTDVLRQEIEKLGGNEKDFELVKDVEDNEDEEWKGENNASGDFDLSEFQKFHQSLKFGDSGMKFMTQKKGQEKSAPEKEKANKEVDPVAKVEPKVEITESPPAKVEEVEYVEDKVLKPLMGSIVRKPKPRKKALLPQGDEAEVWHYSMDELYKKIKVTEDFTPIKPDSEFVKALRHKAGCLVQQESEVKTKAVRDFVKTAADSGTAKDKAAALVLKITSGAVASVPALEQLISMCKKKVRRNFIMCGALLRDVFISDLLPLNRQLYEFHERSQFLIWSAKNQTHPSSDTGLMLAWYEAKIKAVFSEFVTILESAMTDPVDKAKELGLELAASLLEQQPQEESRLLALLVNKLGDPKAKIAQKSTSLLLNLLRKHPNMQEVIVGETESVLYRSNQSPESTYHVLAFLNQMVFSSERHEVPTRLMNLYFGFFSAEVAKRKKQLNQKILLALLTGVNRAFPFAKRDENDAISENMDQLYKLVHHGTFIVGLQSLSLLYQALNMSEEPGDRYYNAVYSLILRPELLVETKRYPMLLNLIYRTVSSDVNMSRQKSFIKRLLMVAMMSKTPFQAAVLVLVGQLLREKRLLRGIIDQSMSSKSGQVSSVGGVTYNQGESDDETSDEEFHDADKEQVKVETKKGWSHKRAGDETKTFDPWARNPSYAGADDSMTWEFASLRKHYHPSVRKFADDVAAKSKEKYPGDPLSDFTTIRFLDRFVYKNPRKVDEEKARKVNVNSRRKNTYLDTTQLPVTSLSFLQKQEDDLPPADRYLHRFFQLRSNGNLSLSQVTKENDGTAADVEDVDDDEFDAILDGQLKGWENKMQKVDFSLATAKQRKSMKKKQKGDEFDELNDEEVDLGDIYSDEDEDEGSGEDIHFEDDMEIEMTPPPKKKKKKVDQTGIQHSAEAMASLLDDADEARVSKAQSNWEKKRAGNGTKKRSKKAKRSKLLN